VEALVSNATFERYMADVKRIPLIDAATERSLATAYRQGDRAAGQQLVLSHLRVAVKIARRFTPSGLQLDDAVQVANVGLLRALETYDPRLGYRFMTYANDWVRFHVQKWLHERYSLRIPDSDVAKRVTRIYREHNPKTCEDLARLAGVPMKKALPFWFVLTARPLSLDHVPDDSTESFSERVAAPTLPETDPLLRDLLERALAELTVRQRDVVESRLVSDPPQTLNEIALRYGVTRERIRQIETKALKKLRQRLAQAYMEAA
jgi:RNA polymerase sigma factor (sigma-70 family)